MAAASQLFLCLMGVARCWGAIPIGTRNNQRLFEGGLEGGGSVRGGRYGGPSQVQLVCNMLGCIRLAARFDNAFDSFGHLTIDFTQNGVDIELTLRGGVGNILQKFTVCNAIFLTFAVKERSKLMTEFL